MEKALERLDGQPSPGEMVVVVKRSQPQKDFGERRASAKGPDVEIAMW